MEFPDRAPSAEMFSIRPGPQPCPLRLNSPGFDAAISIGNAALDWPSTITSSDASPSGADSGIRVSICSDVSKEIGASIDLAPDEILIRVRPRPPNRTPRIVNSAPGAIAPPASVGGMRLAELTTPFCPMPGCAGDSRLNKSRTMPTRVTFKG